MSRSFQTSVHRLPLSRRSTMDDLLFDFVNVCGVAATNPLVSRPGYRVVCMSPRAPLVSFSICFLVSLWRAAPVVPPFILSLCRSLVILRMRRMCLPQLRRVISALFVLARTIVVMLSGILSVTMLFMLRYVRASKCCLRCLPRSCVADANLFFESRFRSMNSASMSGSNGSHFAQYAKTTSASPVHNLTALYHIKLFVNSISLNVHSSLRH